MDPGKADLLTEKICLIACKYRRFQSVPLEVSALDCSEANRDLFCSLCRQRYNAEPFTHSSASIHPPFRSPPEKSAAPSSDSNKLRPRAERPLVQPAFDAFREELIKSTSYNPAHHFRPSTAFFSVSLSNNILDSLLRFDYRHQLDDILKTHSWPFSTSHGDRLWQLIIEQQLYIHVFRDQKKKKKKPVPRRRKTMETDSDSDVSDVSMTDVDIILTHQPDAVSPAPLPTSKRTACALLYKILQMRSPLQNEHDMDEQLY